MTEPVEPFTFSVFGTPRGKSRPRWTGKHMVSTANPHEKLWKRFVERAAFAAVICRGDPLPLFKGPVRCRMVFTFEPPRSDRERIGTPHTLKPDKDNLEKLVLDAMTRAKVFRDDSQVADGPVEKWWGDRAGVVVMVEQIDGSAQSPIAEEPDAPDWLGASPT
jgi:Holliday junction resolvase RusA-like endonuclease